MDPQRLRNWKDDSDADWTVDSEGRSSLSGGSVCALVTSDGQASLRRSNSETDLLVSEEEVNLFRVQEGGLTWLALLACAVLLRTNWRW